MFLVLDGNEGCGKSTQARLLAERLEREGRRVTLVRDPGTSDIGEKIRHLLLDPANAAMSMRTEMLLYMAARAQLMVERIAPALDAGHIVISDRFVSSTLAYQLGGDGLTGEQIRQIAQIAINGRWPDLTLILDLPLEQSMARLKGPKDRIEQRPAAYHAKVRENFLQQAAADPKRIRVVDATGSPEAVQERVYAQVATLPI